MICKWSASFSKFARPVRWKNSLEWSQIIVYLSHSAIENKSNIITTIMISTKKAIWQVSQSKIKHILWKHHKLWNINDMECTRAKFINSSRTNFEICKTSSGWCPAKQFLYDATLKDYIFTFKWIPLKVFDCKS